MRFVPDELGLWRYGWSFRPSPVYPPGSHEGEGLFFVEIPAPAEASIERLESLAEDLIAAAGEVDIRGSRFQTRLNNLVRWGARIEQTGSSADSLAAVELLRAVRSAVSPDRYKGGS
jgi:hypothetical protein